MATRTRDLPYARIKLIVAGSPPESTFDACFARIEKIFRSMDMYRPDSELTAVSRASGVRPVAVSTDILEVMRQGMSLAELSGGRFDPSVGPLVKLWGIGGDLPRVPRADEIRGALELVDWRRVAVNEKAGTVFLRTPGMCLDFGALIKGYAAVETGRVLSARGVASAIVDIGGSVLALGSSAQGGPWRVGLQEPGAPPGSLIGVILARDEVVNTSGLYERFFVSGGKRYAHIMDTRTGYPVDNGVEAVTVIAPRLRNADGPSLTVLSLGAEEGLALASKIGVDAVVISADRTLRMTDGARRRFQLLDNSYRIADR
jgi:FAD:protein FMN transferase